MNNLQDTKNSQPEQEPLALNVTIEGEAAKLLSAMLEPALDGDDPTAIRLMIGNGYSGYGLYVADDEYPEEGSDLLVNTTPPQPREPEHPDDSAVDKFAASMKAKMAKQRAKGYGGWSDKGQCPTERLQQMLVEHLAKGDPVDIGNFAMMLWSRGESTQAPQRKQMSDWIDPNDKTQKQYLPNIGEPVLFCHEGKTYYGKHTGGSFQGVTKRYFDTWKCRWMQIPAAHGN
jgi:hypothetical protein